MKKPTLLLDMDGTIVDLNARTIEMYNLIHKTTFDESKANIYLSDFEPVHPQIKRDHIVDILKQPGFFLSLQPFRGAIFTIEILREKFEVIIVSAPMHESTTCVYEKQKWLDIHLPGLSKTAVFTNNKSIVHGDFLVDDRMKHLTAYKTAHPNSKVGSLRFPWSQEDKMDFCFNDWYEIHAYLINAIKEDFHD